MTHALFYEFETAVPPTRRVRVPAAGAAVILNHCDNTVQVAWQDCTWWVAGAPVLVEAGAGTLAAFDPKPCAKTDPDGCLVREDGECVSPGPCAHTQVPLDENDCPLPTCSECGAYHQVVRPGKTQPTCICYAYRVECDNHQETRRQLDEARAQLRALRDNTGEPPF